MNFKQFAEHGLFNLPIEGRHGEEFASVLKRTFVQYLSLLRSIEDMKEIEGLNRKLKINTIVERQKKFIEGIERTIDLYYDGKPYEAFISLQDTIQSRIKNYRTMIQIGSYQEGESFYRMRKKKDNFSFTKDQMFHIPFEERGRVTTQRFSIPGFPSLYVAKTIYVCWEELRRPDINSFQVSKIRNRKKLNFIDLAPPPLNDEEVYTLAAYGYLMIWPLIAACSVRVKHPADPFKPEYIIPQLLLQWVRSTNEVDGIRYKSTHVQTNMTGGDNFNLVFPVKSSKTNGLCDRLTECFEVSEPISWELLQAIKGGNPMQIPIKNSLKYIDDKLPTFRLFENIRSKYSNSIFGSMEHFLDTLGGKGGNKLYITFDPAPDNIPLDGKLYN